MRGICEGGLEIWFGQVACDASDMEYALLYSFCITSGSGGEEPRS